MKHSVGKIFVLFILSGALTACVSAVVGNFSKPSGVSDQQYAADYSDCRGEGDRVAAQTSVDGGWVAFVAPGYLATVDGCMARKGYSKK